MSTKRIAVPTMLMLALAAVALLLRGKGRLPPTPDEAVNLFFQAAQRGDVLAHLATMTGTLRSSFESTQSQIGDEAFAASLRDSVAGMKGYAVSPVGEASPDRAELDVELVFSDRNERQRFGLLQQSGGWLIERIDKADTVKPPIQYGATVFDTGASVTP
jgi:hypothetical protein